MATAWGAGTWGSGSWGGADQLAGNAATGDKGSVTPSLTKALTGVEAAGFVRTLIKGNLIRKALTGVAASGSVASVTEDNSVALTGVATSGAVGSLTSGQSLVGVAASGAVGSLTPSVTVAIGTPWGLGSWGSGAWGGVLPLTIGDVGTVASTKTQALTGVAASGAVGSVTETN